MSTTNNQLHTVLGTFWDKNVLEVPTEEDDSDGDLAIDDPLIQLDSITAVDVLLDIEKLVGKHLPVEKIVRKGGYESKEQFIEEVTQAVNEFVGEAT